MATRLAPSQSEVERAFADAMQAAGFNPGRIEPDTQGFVRFDAPGDKKGKQNGFYKLKTGEQPVGWFGDWKGGEQHQWFYADPNASPLSDAERAKIKREQARLKAEAAQAREQKQAEVAELASQRWGKAIANVEGHPYLARKRIAIPRGLRLYTATDGAQLLTVPMFSFDMNGQPQLTNLQMIDGDGSKRFMKAGRVEGCFFSLKGDTSYIVLCEGVATAFSIWEATGLSVVAAFNSGNLIPVAKDFARNRPMATIIIAGDDDVIAPDDWAERGGGKPWVNAGRSKAQAAAKAIGCRWITPAFAEGPARNRTDFNDLHLIEGEKAVGAQVMGALRGVEAEDAEPGATIVEIDHVQDESWRSRIPLTSNGNYDGSNVQGVALYIENHKLLRGRLRFNTFTRTIELDGNDMEDFHVAEFRRIMHKDHFRSRKGDVADEMIAEARKYSFDPLTEYLAGLKWDGKPRLDMWMTRHLAAPDSAYVHAVARKALIGSVARALDPGSKNDDMVILEGPQGTGKSTALRYLYGDRFFTDNLPDFHSKDSFQQLQGSWCVEVAELNKMSKADVGDVKQFLSRVEDKYRPPYERMPIRVRRRSVLWGTVNPDEGTGYLKDQTGNRRFYPIECGVIDLSGLLAARDQLWAEAADAYRKGEKWFLTGELAEIAKEEQEKRREASPWEVTIQTWLLEQSRDEVTIAEIMSKCLSIPAERQTVALSRQAGAALRALKWTHVVKRPHPGAKPTQVFMSPAARQKHSLAGGPGAQETFDDWGHGP